MNILDLLGAGFSLCATILFTRVSLSAWGFGLLASCVNVVLFFQLGIYGDMGLEVVYGVLMIYGWLAWSPSANDDSLPISHVTRQQAWREGGLALICIPLVALLLKSTMHSKVPWLDATTTCFSLLAQWWLCRKRVETWVVWLFVDSLYVVLYGISDIPIHALTYFIYCGLAIYGYRNWSTRFTQQAHALGQREAAQQQQERLPENGVKII